MTETQETGMPIKVGPVMVFASAEAFRDAAGRQHAWLQGQGKPLTLIDLMPVYFLYGQSIELGLKAFLRARGLTGHELSRQPFGHDVLALYRECRKHGLVDSVDGTSMVGILAEYYSRAHWYQTFKYIPEFEPRFPTCAAVGSFTGVLFDALRPVCEGVEPLGAILQITQEHRESEAVEIQTNDKLG